MGIDIYARWDGISEEDEDAQYTGFSTAHGHVGYLREAYHGGPYATRVLVPEAFDEDAAIPAATMRERLPRAVCAALTRRAEVYGDAGARAILCTIAGREPTLHTVKFEFKEDELGGLVPAIAAALEEAKKPPNEFDGEVPVAAIDAIAKYFAQVKSLVEFVELCEAKERETGKAVTIVASY